jgi:hypothetical protein
MADFKGFIRLDTGGDQLLFNEVDVEGTPEDCNQFLFWDDFTEVQLIFYVNPPTLPVDPPTSGGGTKPNDWVYSSYNGTRQFVSYNERMFKS